MIMMMKMINMKTKENQQVFFYSIYIVFIWDEFFFKQ